MKRNKRQHTISALCLVMITLLYTSVSTATGLQATYSCSNTYKAFVSGDYISKSSAASWGTITTCCANTYYSPSGEYTYYVAKLVDGNGIDQSPYISILMSSCHSNRILHFEGSNTINLLKIRIKNAFYHEDNDQTHRLIITGGVLTGTVS